MKLMRKKLNKKGFSLIELIVVIAILAIIAAVAIPRFAEIQVKSTIRSDGASGAEIVGVARVFMADMNQVTVPTVANLAPDYIDTPSLLGGDAFVLGVNDTAADITVNTQVVPPGRIYVTWTATDADYGAQVVIENIRFILNE